MQTKSAQSGIVSTLKEHELKKNAGAIQIQCALYSQGVGKVQFTVHGLNTNAKYKSSQSSAQCVVSSLLLQRVEKVQIQMFNKYKYSLTPSYA